MRRYPLTPENEHALYMYGLIANQFCYDLHMGPFVLQSHGYPPGDGRTNELLETCILIHAIKNSKEDEQTPDPAPGATDV